jgi:O-antigen ligase
MWLLLLMILVMPYESNPYLYISPSFLGIVQDFTVIKLLGLAGFAWALLKIAGGAVPEGVFTSRQAKLFALFVLGVVLAGVLSGSGFVAVSRYVSFLLFLPFVLVAVRTEDDLRRVLAAAALSLVLTFPYAIRQMVRFGDRLGVGLYEPNYFAANLALIIPVAVSLALTQRRPGHRALWLGGAGVLALSLVLTGSRGGFLGLLIAAAVFVYRRRGMAAALGLVTVLIVAALPTTLGERALSTLFEDRQADVGLEASNQAHMALFWGALRMIADSPLTGVGPYNFKELSSAYSGLDQRAIAHNSYLELAAELGIPVLVIFLSMVAATFRGLRRAVGAAGVMPDVAAWAEGMRSGLIGFLVAAAFISAQYEKWLWLVVFLTIVVERLALQRQHEALETTRRERTEVAALDPVPSPS